MKGAYQLNDKATCEVKVIQYGLHSKRKPFRNAFCPVLLTVAALSLLLPHQCSQSQTLATPVKAVGSISKAPSVISLDTTETTFDSRSVRLPLNESHV